MPSEDKSADLLRAAAQLLEQRITRFSFGLGQPAVPQGPWSVTAAALCAEIALFLSGEKDGEVPANTRVP